MRYRIVTLGCPKNDVDSEMMAEILRRAGHAPAPSNRRADVLIVNTCSFVHDAREESYGALRELAAGKRRGQFLVAAVSRPALRRGIYEVPGVDAVLGTSRGPDRAPPRRPAHG